jgi:hypothetical protein
MGQHLHPALFWGIAPTQCVVSQLLKAFRGEYPARCTCVIHPKEGGIQVLAGPAPSIQTAESSFRVIREAQLINNINKLTPLQEVALPSKSYVSVYDLITNNNHLKYLMNIKNRDELKILVMLFVVLEFFYCYAECSGATIFTAA